jgi:hypothetical protein
LNHLEPRQDELNTLAGFVLDIVSQLQQLVGQNAAESTLRQVSIREITFSVPYVAELGSLPLPADRVLHLPLAKARPYLLKNDRPVVLEYRKLRQLPKHRLMRLRIRIRLPE